MEKLKYKQIEHLSDVGIESYGRTLKELFENSALGMFSVMGSLKRIDCKKKDKILVKEKNLLGIEDLLLSFLQKLLFKFETERILYSEFNVFKVDKDKGLVKAEVCGEEVNLKKHKIKVMIKAVTYHMLQVRKNELWKATIIFDI
ncbi:MAG: archease [Actinomycetota bacterium]